MLKKFSKIGQFRETIKEVVTTSQYDGKDDNGKAKFNPNAIIPTLNFHGTVKLHGTNACVGVTTEGEVFAQKRNGFVNLEEPGSHFGFAFWVRNNEEFFQGLKDDVMKNPRLKPHKGAVYFYGEWAGNSIQKSVAISQFDKAFYMFGIKFVATEVFDPTEFTQAEIWTDIKTINNNEEINFFNVENFKTYDIEIDFNNPRMVQNKLVELTQEVEDECPIASERGIKGLGEGIVWVGEFKNKRITFKTKGEKHSESKVKTLVEVDPELLKNINEFVDYSCTENRMEHAIHELFTSNDVEPTVKDTGTFLKWLVNDIIKEESDVMLNSGLEPRDVTKVLSTRARKWFFKKLDFLASLDHYRKI